MTHAPDPLEAMQAALQAADKANLRLFLALDYAVSLGLMTPATTSVLNALDYARSCAAAMFQYLPAVQPGPTQDQPDAQRDEEAIGQFMGGFLTLDELASRCDWTLEQARDVIEARVTAITEALPLELEPESLERHEDGTVTLTFLDKLQS